MKNFLHNVAFLIVTVLFFTGSTASAESNVIHRHFSPAFVNFDFNMQEEFISLGYWNFTWKCRYCGYRVTLKQGVQPD